MPFIVRAKLSIASGAPIRGVNVQAALKPAGSTTLSPNAFIQQQYSITMPTSKNQEPALYANTSTALSNADGVARLVLVFEAGATNALTLPPSPNPRPQSEPQP